MFALHDLVTSGKVLYVGASNFTSWQLNEANRIVREHGLTPFVTLQQQYSLLCRNLEWDIIDVLKKDSVGILPWSPLAGGWLSGRYKRGASKEEQGSAWNGRRTPAGRRRRSATTPTRRRGRCWTRWRRSARRPGRRWRPLRWLLQKDLVSSVLIGARTVQQLQDNIEASHFSLSEEQVELLDDASHIPMPYPYSLLKGELMRKKK